jgi:hypothetical protein
MREIKPVVLAIAMITISPALYCGCASMTGIKPLEAHRERVENVLEDEYFAPKKPVDRHYIGFAWSRQFGPIEDSSAPDIRVKKERSLSAFHQELAYNRGFALGGKKILSKVVEAGLKSGGSEKSKFEDVDVITAVSLADIAFKPNVLYVTEALRIANFQVTDERSTKGGISLSAGMSLGIGSASVKGETQTASGTEGEGLIVAYKLHMMDTATYTKQESGGIPLVLDNSVVLPNSDLIVHASLHTIEPGAGKSFPRNLLWACARAEAKSRDMVAAWLVEIKSLDPMRKSLILAFPAYPDVEDCRSYDGIIFTRVDPATDKIFRQKIRVTIVNAELTDSMKPKTWNALVSLLVEFFNIKLVRPSDYYR